LIQNAADAMKKVPHRTLTIDWNGNEKGVLVDNHVAKINKKLEVRNRQEAVVRAKERGIID
jgi:hypothetical protein